MDRHVELEQAIENNPDDTDTYAVLADWLQSRGDPRGELIALQLANKDDQARALLAKHADAFLGGLAAHQKTHDGEDRDAFTWRNGFIHGVRLSHNHYAAELEGTLAQVLEQLLAHPSGRFLAEVTLVFNNDPNENNLQDLIDVLAARPRPTLRKLHLGDFKYAGAVRDEDQGEDTEISWYSVGDLSNLWQAVPNLTTLIVQSGSAESAMAGGVTLGTLDLPALRHLEVRTGGLEAANANAIVTARVPNLEHLDIWFGREDYGGTATIDDAQRLLARSDLPKLHHLGLMNAEFTDELVPRLAASRLVAQLRELDLSLGCLSDDGARALAAHADAFTKLDKLDVSYSCLTGEGIAALKGVAKQIIADEQREQDDERYAAVGE